MDDWSRSISEVSDQQLQEALAHAHVPALMATLMHLNGNTDHFAAVQPCYQLFAEDEDGLTEADREVARGLGFQALVRYRETGCPELARPSENDITTTMHYIAGEPNAHLETVAWNELEIVFSTFLCIINIIIAYYANL